MMGAMNREVQILRRTRTQDSVRGSYSDVWVTVATVWGEVQDMLPSRAERIADGIDIAQRPARVRIYYREDITTDMRFKVLGRSPDEADRNMRIIAGPAELGFRDRVEFAVEELTTEGQEP